MCGKRHVKAVNEIKFYQPTTSNAWLSLEIPYASKNALKCTYSTILSLFLQVMLKVPFT